MTAPRDKYEPRQMEEGPEDDRDLQEDGVGGNHKVVGELPSHTSAGSPSRAPSTQLRTALLPSSAPTAWRPTEARQGRSRLSMHEVEHQVESTGNEHLPSKMQRPNKWNWAPW